ncbi:MAG TPA: hypothetical protein VN661_09595 [Candidatus Acidoferrales bacterium]|nr:hypothetical protein [Candidatus Acidoferrales bacterium]
MTTDDDLQAHVRELVPQEIRPHPRRSMGRAMLVTGLYTGACLIVVMLGSLVAANRIPRLEPYALERNAVAYCVFVLLMFVPVARFLNRPGRMFGAAVIGWTMFVIAYDFAGLYFRDLFNVLRTPFQAFVEGTAVYGILAAAGWVAAMILHARNHPITSRRRPASGGARDRVR